MERWEKASTSLVSALAEYQSSCVSWYNSSLHEQTSLEYPIAAARIDSSLSTLHPAMVQQLAVSSVTLARTRNRLSSPLQRLPNEILAEIILNDLYSPSGDFNKPKLSLERRLLQMVRRRHCLQSVCSSWREVIISRGELWSTVPLTKSTINVAVLEQWLPRAAGHGLYLGADTVKTLSSDVTKYLVSHMSRFNAISIEARSLHIINNLLYSLVGIERIKSLTELTIRRIPTHPRLDEHGFPILSDFTDAVDPPPVKIDSLLGSLSVLRLRHVHLDWNSISFPDTLLELHLHEYDFRTDPRLVTCLQKLSSASQLRVIRIVSSYASRGRTMGTTQSTSSVSTLKVTFPSLQYLYLEDLSPSTLKTVFTTITPGDYQVALHLTNRIHRTYDADTVAKSFIFASLEDILSLGHIHTLSIVGLQDTWLASDVFHAILKLLPTLKVLKLHGWSFMKPVWQALQRPGTRDQPSHIPFPYLEQVHLTQARIVEEDGLEEMIESHLDSIQLVELGARNATMARPNLRGPYQGSENIIVWLRSKVPKLYLTDPERLPRDLGSPIEWQSW